MSSESRRLSGACPACGQSFSTTKARVADGRGKFCSMPCRARVKETRHGHTTSAWQSPTYRSWSMMLQRCLNPNAAKYPQYGGAGITVCDEWRVFDAFLADMGARPEGTSIDRIDGSQGYCKSNCRWATRLEQQGNLKNNVLISYQGQEYHLSALYRLLGLGRDTIMYRIQRGWPEDMWGSRPTRRAAAPTSSGTAPAQPHAAS